MPRYAAHGTALLRLVGLSTPFTALVVLYATLAWLDQRVWLLAAVQAALGLVMLGLTLVLLPRLGLVGVGWAYLASQGLAAAAAVPFTLRRIRRLELARAR